MREDMTVYTVKNVADILKVEPHFVYRLLRTGALRSKRLGTKVIRIPEDALEEYMVKTRVRCRGEAISEATP